MSLTGGVDRIIVPTETGQAHFLGGATFHSQILRRQYSPHGMAGHGGGLATARVANWGRASTLTAPTLDPGRTCWACAPQPHAWGDRHDWIPRDTSD
eukprot:scaffold34082_cov62-Phaeocystis_antarctica.AAC.4